MQDFQGMWKPWLLSKYKDSPKGVLEEHISCEFLLSTTSAKKQYLPSCRSLPLINASSWRRLQPQRDSRPCSRKPRRDLKPMKF